MGTGRRLAGAMAAAAAFALVAPANAALPTAPNRELNFLHVGSPNPANGLPQVVDTRGREVLLKGVNVDGIVDYWDADASHPPPPSSLKPPYPNDPAAYSNGRCPPDDPRVEGVMVCDSDFDQMRPLGYDAIRLNLSWSLLEPQPGKIDRQYVDRIAQIVGWARRAGIYVVLDMHQDAWSNASLRAPRRERARPRRRRGLSEVLGRPAGARRGRPPGALHERAHRAGAALPR
ncbi:MAG: hypothetical protein E6G29_11300 [Actinobacteria bacterium]|nr:MAG: hypothetical protein E6G29_11300 [Actinomycetota bacterium]